MVLAHAADLYRFAYWLSRDRAVAEDMVQETYARAWAHWEDVRDERAAKGWLLTILHNEHARLYERKRLDIDERELDEIDIASDHQFEDGVDMRDALWALPEALREALLLQVLGGFTCAEIAKILKTSEAGVMQRVSRARKAMRVLLSPDGQRREYGS